MDQINNIKFLFKHKEKSLREISRDTGHHFNTVNKYVNENDFNLKINCKSSKPRKLAPYAELIDSWLLADLDAKPKQRHTAKRVYDRLKELYPEFDVSERSVRSYVSKKKKKFGLNIDGYIPLDHPPGEAQADFGEAQFIENGIKYDGRYLNLSFPYSNGGYLYLLKSENQECLLEGLRIIFEHVSKVPRAIWFDNMSTAVKAIKKYGKRDINKGFERFMLHYGFQSNFCNPDSGHEKGSVENKVGYHRRNFLVPIPEFDDIDEFNKQLLKLCDEDMHRKHYKKSQSITALYEDDKLAMDELPEVPFDVFRLEPVKADKYGKVRFDNKIYSSSPDYSGQALWLKVRANKVEVLDQKYQTIVIHPRLYGQQQESMLWGPYLRLMAKRPTALKYTGFFKELPVTIQDYFNKCDYIEKKNSLQLLVGMLEENDIQTASEAFEESLRKNLFNADSVLAIYNRMNSSIIEEKHINLPQNLPEIKPFTSDIKVYDLLIKGGN